MTFVSNYKLFFVVISICSFIVNKKETRIMTLVSNLALSRIYCYSDDVVVIAQDSASNAKHLISINFKIKIDFNNKLTNLVINFAN